MIFSDSHHFNIFKNKQLDSLYLTSALRRFAMGLVSIFVPIYLWQLNFSITQILIFYLLYSLYLILIVFTLLPLMRRLSDKELFFLSIPFTLLFFAGLRFLPDYGLLFFILPGLEAVGSLFFNFPYHSDFTDNTDGGHEGQEVGGYYSVVSITEFTSPFVGGMIIALAGHNMNFLIAGIFMVLAMIPMFLLKSHKTLSYVTRGELLKTLKSRSLMPFHISSMSYASETMVARIVWPIFMFLAISDIGEFGSVISISFLLSAIASYIIGYVSDQGMRRRSLKWLVVFMFFIWVSRAFIGAESTIIGSQILGKIVFGALMVTWMSQFYKLSSGFAHAGSFVLSQEVLYNLTRMVFLPILIIISYLVPENIFFLTSFVLAGLVIVLFSYANQEKHVSELEPEVLKI